MNLRGGSRYRNLTIPAPPVFGDGADLERLTLPDLDGIPDGTHLTVDLRELVFISPAALVGILALMDRYQGDPPRRELRIIVPINQEVCSYLQKVRFLDALGDLAPVQSPGTSVLIPEVSTLFPIGYGTNELWVEEVADELARQFSDQLAGTMTLLAPCHLVFAELASNAVEHANGRRVWALAQHDPRHKSIVIAVADSGIGIRASLERSGKYDSGFRSDTEAVRHAFRDGVSCVPSAYRGYGLGHVVAEIARPDRKLLVRSGRGSVTVYQDGRIRAAPCENTVGTLATVNIPYV